MDSIGTVMDYQSIISSAIKDSIETKKRLLCNSHTSIIETVADRIKTSLYQGGKVLLCGNGGSAADSQHIAAEFVSRFLFDRPAMAAIALTTDTSALTAIGNDYGFEKLFERQVQALGANGDIFIGISTSGNSVNIRNAAIAASEKGMITIGLAGEGGEIWQHFDHVIRAPSEITARVQECHILFGHILCELVEQELWK
jgi:D-sedoheptulose 7-phosphate isomerase